MNGTNRLKVDLRIFFKENAKFLQLFTSLILGILFGVLKVKHANTGFSDKISTIVTEYLNIGKTHSFFQIFFDSLASMLPYVALAILLGLCVVGAPVILGIPFFKGLAFGTIAAYLYANIGIKGIIYSLIILVPSTLIAFFALLFLCKESLRFSLLLYSAVKPSGTALDLWNELKLFVFRNSIFILIFIISAFLEAALTTSFSGFFKIS